MKKFNKIVAVLLAISLLSSFAVFASAEVSTGTFQMRYTDTDGKQITSAAAGDVIDVYVAINTADRYVSAFQADIMYDFAKVTQIRNNGTAVATVNAKNCRELLGDMADSTTYIDDMSDPWVQYDDENDAWGGYYLCGYGTFTATPHTDNLYPSSWDDAKKAAYKCCRFSYVTNYTDATLGVYTNNAFVDIARFRFYANEDITTLDSSVIGWSEGADFVMNTDGQNIGLSVYMNNGIVEMPTAVAYAEAADPVVYAVKNQIQWADKDAGTVNLGIVAGFDIEDIAIDFDDNGTSTNVTAVGATVTINGTTATKTERFVYKANDGASYYFRTVISGVDKAYNGDIVVTPFVEMGEETYYGDAITITAENLATYVAKLPA